MQSVARKLLGGEQLDKPDVDFTAIQVKLNEISKNIQELLQHIEFKEARDSYVEYVKCINYQYNTLMEVVKTGQNMSKFKEAYENANREKGLFVLYEGVKGKDVVFFKPLLKLYQEHYKNDYEKMRNYCSDLWQLFCMGFTTVMVYTAIDNDDLNQAHNKWCSRMEEIAEEMTKVLDECKKKKSQE
ncbi:uncharacterized protein LOC101486494 [Arapaima gigas]